MMEHILLHCPMISGLWTTLFSLQGGGWVCPYSVQELFLGWKILEGQKIVEDGSTLPLWAIWKERNIIVFEDKQFSLDRLKSSFLRTIRSWASVISNGDYTLVRFLFCTLY